MTAWIVVGVVGAASLGLKGLGPVLFGGRPIPPAVLGVVALLTPTLLAALVATQVFGGDRELVFDARAVGLAAAVVALLARLPVLAVVAVAAAATALARALT
jgi:Branched-chain amino acid transport protein (AzlD)